MPPAGRAGRGRAGIDAAGRRAVHVPAVAAATDREGLSAPGIGAEAECVVHGAARGRSSHWPPVPIRGTKKATALGPWSPGGAPGPGGSVRVPTSSRSVQRAAACRSRPCAATIRPAEVVDGAQSTHARSPPTRQDCFTAGRRGPCGATTPVGVFRTDRVVSVRSVEGSSDSRGSTLAHTWTGHSETYCLHVAFDSFTNAVW